MRLVEKCILLKLGVYLVLEGVMKFVVYFRYQCVFFVCMRVLLLLRSLGYVFLKRGLLDNLKLKISGVVDILIFVGGSMKVVCVIQYEVVEVSSVK